MSDGQFDHLSMCQSVKPDSPVCRVQRYEPGGPKQMQMSTDRPSKMDAVYIVAFPSSVCNRTMESSSCGCLLGQAHIENSSGGWWWICQDKSKGQSNGFNVTLVKELLKAISNN